MAWDGQTTRALPPGHPLSHPRDNVDAPLSGDRGAHGPFDHIARTSSTTFWLRANIGALLGGSLAVASAFALARWSAQRR